MSAIADPSLDRGRAIEFGASALVHVALFAGLSLVLLSPPKPPPPPAPMDVTIADDVGLTARAPQAIAPPAQSQAPDLGKPENAAPPPPEAVPEPAPQKPQPATPAPAPPQPKPKPAAPIASAKVAPIAKPQPAKPAAVPARPQPTRAPARPAPSGALAGIVGRGSGTAPGATARTPRGAALGSVMSGLGANPTKSTATTPQGATMSAAAATDIGRKILQQVQPCANRQVNPGPGASQIRVSLKLRINRDGTLAGRPQIVGHDGVDDGNRRYLEQVDDRAVSTFMGCQPLRGLPPELYDVPNGWSNFTMRYKLPG